MRHDYANEGITPEEVLTDEEYAEAMNENHLTDKQREQLDRMEEKFNFFNLHPDLLPGHVPDTVDVSGMEVDYEVPNRGLFEDSNTYWDEISRRRVRAQVRKLRGMGLPIEKQAFGDDAIKVIARVNEHLALTLYLYGSCVMVDTDETERIEEVELPDNIREAYTVTKVVHKKKRVCAPLLGPSEIEAL